MLTIDHEGARIRYDVFPGPSGKLPLLLTHGYGIGRTMWRTNVDALAATRTVVTWDMRGHGDSDSPGDPSLYSHELTVADMGAILDACHISRVVLGGLSLGGFMSLDFYRKHPARVHSLLLFATGPGFRRHEPREAWNRQANRTADRLLRMGISGIGNPPEFADERVSVQGLTHAARGMLTQHDGAIMQLLPDIKVPTLIVVGGDDTKFLAPADYMARTIVNSEKVVIPGARHLVNVDQAQAFNAAVCGFLAREC